MLDSFFFSLFRVALVSMVKGRETMAQKNLLIWCCGSLELLVEAILLAVLAGRQLQLEGSTHVTPSWCSLIWRRPLWLPSALDATMAVDGACRLGSCSSILVVVTLELRHLQSGSKAGLHRQATTTSGRRAANSFAPDLDAIWEVVAALAWRPWHAGVAAMAVSSPQMVRLGDGEAGFEWKLRWARLHFYLSVWGPPCKSQGLVCNLCCCLGLYENCIVSPLDV